ncbi:MAG: AAA family ATPase [Geobacter sp.]|nr:AAA family ATPase [Geobacter sp.]
MKGINILHMKYDNKNAARCVDDIDHCVYASILESIDDDINRIRLAAQWLIKRNSTLYIQNNSDNLRNYVILDEEIESLLSSPDGFSTASPDRSDNDGTLALLQQYNDLCAQIDAKKRITAQTGPELPGMKLARLFRLTPFEEICLAVCCAPELDKRYERLYAYLHDDLTLKHPTPGLIMDLFCHTPQERVDARQAFAASAPLLQYGLLIVGDPPQGSASRLLSCPLSLDRRVADHLLGLSGIDDRLARFVRLEDAVVELGLVTLSEEACDRLRGFARQHLERFDETDRHVVLHFHGTYGTGRKSVARAICHDLGRPLLLADAEQLLDGPIPFAEAALILAREAALQSAVLCLEQVDSLVHDEANARRLRLLAKILGDLVPLTILIGSKPWQPRGMFGDHLFLGIDFPLPDDSARQRLWEQARINGTGRVEGVDFGTLAGTFRFSPGQIRDATRAAGHLAAWQQGENAQRVTAAELYAACRDQSNQKLSALAHKIEPAYGWDDIVLPADHMDQLRELCNQARYRHVVYGSWGFGRKLSTGKGLNVLFSGPPGTGKTMGAEVIAHELGLDLYKIDLSQVVSKYIGETEKNLDRIFSEARTCNAILFFDEADALFGKRSEVKDAHDRYANIEIGYLLQKMEEYEGVAILATNFRSNLDEAFVRRLQYVVEFPLPPLAERRRIWEKVWPDAAPLDAGLDPEFLAQRFEIAGGNIRNIALAAAFMAADEEGDITMQHLLRATRREFQKMGKIVSEGDFGTV